MADTNDSVVVLYRANNLFEAQAILSALEDAGLTARLEGEFLGTALGDIPFGSSTAPRIVVRNDQLAQAQEILKDFLSLPHQSSDGDL